MRKYVGQITLLFLAFVTFYIGLGVGLQVNSTLGSALWLLAGLLVIVAVVWLVKASSVAEEEEL